MATARTDHQIVALGDNLMHLLDNTDGAVIVTATRTGQTWTVHADGADDTTTDTRAEAVYEMTEQALAILPGDGYSTTVPLTEQP